MKLLLPVILILCGAFNSKSQNPEADTADVSAHSIRAIAKVIHSDYDYMTIIIEEVIAYGPNVTATPVAGDEIPVRMPGRDKPQIESRIEVDLKEKIDVGAMPTSYIMLDYRTID